MPAVQPNSSSRVLVTGANGYIAMSIVRALLEEGYIVRGTVRSEAKGNGLREYFRSYGSKLEIAVIEDITKDGAFDDFVQDVDGIEHVASPPPDAGEDPEDLIKPAVNGTLSLLNSALKFGANLKRIVYTSSCIAVAQPVTKPTAIFDETSWADEAVRMVREKGRAANRMEKYGASKTLAEKAGWEFYDAHKHEIAWDLVVLTPPLVLGPQLQDANAPSDLASTLGLWYRMISTDIPDETLQRTYGYIDIRDATLAHVLALKKEEAGGERIIISAGSATWQQTRNTLYSLCPQLYEAGVLPRGNTNLDEPVLLKYNNAKSKSILGLEYRTTAQTFSDALAYFEAKGWIKT